MNRPLIGISCNIHTDRSSNFPKVVQNINHSYIKAIELAGGIPLVIPNDIDISILADLSEKLDGFLFTGGGDIDPKYYGKANNGECRNISASRDKTESFLSEYVLNHTAKPVFGICRGLQVLNVSMGGTLLSDLESAGKNRHSLTEYPRSQFTHEIAVESGTRLKQIMYDETRVNSFHHQAIDKLADGLIVSAYSVKDRVIEAVEAVGERYIVAVQWHPEELIDNADHKRLFEVFINEASQIGNQMNKDLLRL